MKRTWVRQLTTLTPASGIWCPLLASEGICIHAYTHTHIYISILKNVNYNRHREEYLTQRFITNISVLPHAEIQNTLLPETPFTKEWEPTT